MQAGALSYADALPEVGFQRGLASPCCFEHHTKALKAVVHGDDVTCLGPKAEVLRYEEQLGARFEIKKRGHIGESVGCVDEIRILNRILRLTDEGLRYEADPAMRKRLSMPWT